MLSLQSANRSVSVSSVKNQSRGPGKSSHFLSDFPLNHAEENPQNCCPWQHNPPKTDKQPKNTDWSTGRVAALNALLRKHNSDETLLWKRATVPKITLKRSVIGISILPLPATCHRYEMPTVSSTPAHFRLAFKCIEEWTLSVLELQQFPYYLSRALNYPLQVVSTLYKSQRTKTRKNQKRFNLLGLVQPWMFHSWYSRLCVTSIVSWLALVVRVEGKAFVFEEGNSIFHCIFTSQTDTQQH